MARTPPPTGLKVYLTGPSVLVADMHSVGDKSLLKITGTTVAVIFIMLLLVYRSFITVILLLLMVGVEFACRPRTRRISGTISELSDCRLLPSTCSPRSRSRPEPTTASSSSAGIKRPVRPAKTGNPRTTPCIHGVTHVILASGLTIAGATYCLSFTRLPYFQTLGIPCAVGMLVAVAVALTLGRPFSTVGSRFRLFDPTRMIKVHGWRRVGTVVVRWPRPFSP